MSDPAKFIRGVNAREPVAWQELYRLFYGALCSYSLSVTTRDDATEDIVQDTLVAVWKSEAQFNDARALAAYLYKAVYSNTLKYLRDRGTEDKRRLEWLTDRLDEDDGKAFYMAVEEEIVRRLQIIIGRLPHQRRTILMLSMDGLTVQQIADRLGISANTVKTQKKRAYAFLKERLKETYWLLILLEIIK